MSITGCGDLSQKSRLDLCPATEIAVGGGVVAMEREGESRKAVVGQLIIAPVGVQAHWMFDPTERIGLSLSAYPEAVGRFNENGLAIGWRVRTALGFEYYPVRDTRNFPDEEPLTLVQGYGLAGQLSGGEEVYGGGVQSDLPGLLIWQATHIFFRFPPPKFYLEVGEGSLPAISDDSRRTFWEFFAGLNFDLTWRRIKSVVSY
ncbi:MAG: hypothetical protein HY539_03960 [Deltaproteobacteria bacterium]|nr:hypothetical protein [Deltaproteobacteria bacterium]